MTDLSLVIPVYNEEQNLPLLFDAIQQALGPLTRSWEVVFVDDGSRDGSVNVLETLAARDPEHVRVVAFRRNFGQTAAMAAGFDAATGRVVIPMDGDLQNDPADIPLLMAKIEEGYDVVSGWRKDRQDAAISRKVPSMIAAVSRTRALPGPANRTMNAAPPVPAGQAPRLRSIRGGDLAGLCNEIRLAKERFPVGYLALCLRCRCNRRFQRA